MNWIHRVREVIRHLVLREDNPTRIDWPATGVFFAYLSLFLALLSFFLWAAFTFDISKLR